MHTYVYTHTQTHTASLVMDCRMGRKKTADQYVEEKRWVFRFVVAFELYFAFTRLTL